MTRAEMLARISSRELSEWMAYYSLEPWGEMQAEYRAALITSMIANTARDEKAHSEPFQPSEFMRESYLGAEEEEDDGVNVFEKARALFAGFFGIKKG